MIRLLGNWRAFHMGASRASILISRQKAFRSGTPSSPTVLWLQAQFPWTCNKSAAKTGKAKKRERLVILGMLINIHELLSLLPFSKLRHCCQLFHRSLSRPLSKNIAEPPSAISLSFLSVWLYIGILLKDADWTESCPANDPGYQVLQVSLAFIPSTVFATRETCSTSTVSPIMCSQPRNILNDT